MSLYETQYLPDTPERWLLEAGKIMYTHAEFPAKHFPVKEEYLRRVVQDSSGHPCIVAFRDNWFCGGMTVTELGTDSHMPGTGRFVLNVVAHPFEAGATEAMFSHFKRLLRDEEAAWYQITKRVSELEFRSYFRRLRYGV